MRSQIAPGTCHDYRMFEIELRRPQIQFAVPASTQGSLFPGTPAYDFGESVAIDDETVLVNANTSEYEGGNSITATTAYIFDF